MPPPDHAVRIRDGDREIEVSGNPAFVRQVLDDLPTLMARLRGEAPGRNATSMPPPPAQPSAPAIAPDDRDASEPSAESLPPATPSGKNGAHVKPAGAKDVSPSLEDRVFQVLRGSGRPLAIAAIRQRLDGPEVTGQQVRRLLERAGPRVTVSSDRPATYSLR
jgi:hypothetical protein